MCDPFQCNYSIYLMKLHTHGWCDKMSALTAIPLQQSPVNGAHVVLSVLFFLMTVGCLLLDWRTQIEDRHTDDEW